jgi:hypothetical protein
VSNRPWEREEEKGQSFQTLNVASFLSLLLMAALMETLGLFRLSGTTSHDPLFSITEPRFFFRDAYFPFFSTVHFVEGI